MSSLTIRDAKPMFYMDLGRASRVAALARTFGTRRQDRVRASLSPRAIRTTDLRSGRGSVHGFFEAGVADQ
jgi:hypothetical protein